MKNEMPVKIFQDACKKARADGKRNKCPLYMNSPCCQEECNVPKFVRWLLGKEVYPSDAPEVD